MNKEIYEEIVQTLSDRGDFESKQEGFYKLRFGGINRPKKPYPNAPDMHYPLADSCIDDLKPLYIQQLYAGDQIAQMVSTKQQTPEATESAAEWFDYHLKQCSNFEEEIYSAIDQKLECGFITVKAYYEHKAAKLCFSAVDNMHTVVPSWTEDLQAADWFVHIIPLSKAQYKRDKNFTDRSDDFIKSLVGDDYKASGDQVKKQLAELREGLAQGQDKSQIIVWEVWCRETDESDSCWCVHTISPLLGWEEPLRSSFKNPYKHGMLPFFRLRCEITKKGWYTSRGVPELLAPLQMGLKKLWDGSLQFIDFNCLPTYKNTGSTPLPNGNNYQSSPGGILPPGVDAAANPSAPIDFQVQMATMRAVAEDRIKKPDLGNPVHYAGRAGQQQGHPTATQVNAEVGMSGQSNDMRARVFRLDLAKGLKLAWEILIDCAKDAKQYLLENKIKMVDPAALHGEYSITPNGSPDSWNKGAQLQKAIVRFQMFRGDPYTNQAELRKAVWELDDSRLVKRLFVDPGLEMEQQGEQQAQEISIMILGRPAQVLEADDDKAHLKEIDDFVKRKVTMNEQIAPELAKLLLMHGGGHVQGLKTKKDPMLRQIIALTMPSVKLLEQIAASAPSNVVPMSPQGQQGEAPPAPEPISDKEKLDASDAAQKTEIAKGNMLATMVKAGIPVTHAEINRIMANLGLAPLSMNPMSTSELNGLPPPALEDTGPSERPETGMVTPPSEAPPQPPVNVIHIPHKKKITVKRQEDGSLVGEVEEIAQ